MYAEDTKVPVERSRADIEGLLRRYGATAFNTGWDEQHAIANITFRIEGLCIRFILPLPKRDEFSTKVRYGRKVKMTDRQIESAVEAETRRRWRALRLVVQAKLEAIASKISTIVNEFMAFIVMADGTQFGEWAATKALPAIREGSMPILEPHRD